MIPRPKRFARAVRYPLIRAALGLAAFLPRAAIAPLGKLLGALGYALLGGERRKALGSLAVAFPELSANEHRDMAHAMFMHLAHSALELAIVRKLDRDLEAYVELPVESAAIYRAALARGKGAVFVTAHLGNWELLARRLARTGLPCATIAKEMVDPRLTALVDRIRARGGLRTLWRGAPGAAKAMLRTLKQGGALGLLIDQDTKVQGVFVEFFGRPAFTPRAAADLVLRTGAAALVGFIHRKPGGGHRMEISELEAPNGRNEAAVVELTARFTREIERAIRAHPGEWVWLHQRWKTRPTGNPELASATAQLSSSMR